MFINAEDYRVVIGDAALKVVSQSTPENIATARKSQVTCARSMTAMPFSRLRVMHEIGSS